MGATRAASRRGGEAADAAATSPSTAVIKQEDAATSIPIKREPHPPPSAEAHTAASRSRRPAPAWKAELTPAFHAKLEGAEAPPPPKRARTAKATVHDPFPHHHAPSADECRAVHAALARLHPEVVREKRRQAEEGACGGRTLVLDALVGTILSQNTTDTNSHRAFSQLKALFPTWEEVRLAPAEKVADAIRSGGLAATKTERIQSILEMLRQERGACSLEYLRDMEDDAVKEELRRFKGVGAKTISCVLMFCLKRADFPVDTHVWKIALALGWVPKSADRDQTYEHLNRRVPADIKYELHVLLVKHGKVYKNQVQELRKACAAIKTPAADIAE
ncbi:hypothetical protein AB1Y20_004757 [Prymnesium parvum]|uniref:HhH-GPD domain-containing protein n=1 Tax=Prymnesium parvum TaxID=97485 RepID=A0AB34IX74_PRYPA